jgi:hypothetical protein
MSINSLLLKWSSNYPGRIPEMVRITEFLNFVYHPVGVSTPHLRTETAPVSEACFLEYWMMDKVHKPSNSKCYTPSSEPFIIYSRDGDRWMC